MSHKINGLDVVFPQPNGDLTLPFMTLLHLHFTPTSASWLNMVERFFRDLSTQRLERGVFRSVPELIATIKEYVAVHNKNPKPFIWTAKAADILQKVIRANRHLSSKQNEALH